MKFLKIYLIFKMVIKKIKDIKNFRVGGQDRTSHHLPITLQDIKIIIAKYEILDNQIYRDLLYLCLQRQFVYRSELNNLFNKNIKSHLQRLQDLGILQNISMSKTIKNFLSQQQGINKSNLEKIKLYDLTPQAREFYTSEQIKNLIVRNTSLKTKNYLEHQQKEITRLETQRKLQEEQNKNYSELQYKRIMLKNPHYRTAEDLAFLQIYNK